MATFETVSKIIAEQASMETSEIKPESKMEDLQLDSLDMFQILSDIEDEMGIHIDSEEQPETVQQFVEMVDAAK